MPLEAGHAAAGNDRGRWCCSPNQPEGELPKIIFAALDADVARELEPKFAEAGCAVISNSSAFRMTADVPLVVPEVNDDHLPMIERQSCAQELRRLRCDESELLRDRAGAGAEAARGAFGIESLFVSTMQAVSGAGYPGVASLDILGNVVPFIKNEEEKLQEEVGKLLGRNGGRSTSDGGLTVSAHCNRVAVIDGHTECVSIKLRKPATQERSWRRGLS